MAKNQRIYIRITDEEKEELETLARIQGFNSLSAYMRLIALKKSLASKEKDGVIGEIKGVIVLLKSLMYKVEKM